MTIHRTLQSIIFAALAFLAAGSSQNLRAQSRPATKADVDRLMREVSNWGRWGADDQLGALNLITTAKRKAAAALVKEGVTISLARDIVRDTGGRGGSFQELSTQPPAAATVGFNFDVYTMSFHGYVFTHVDALSHMFYEGRMYNGIPRDRVTPAGAAALDVQKLAKGIITRGVLIDLAWLRGVPYLDSNVIIYPEDLDAWEKKTGVKISSGDAVFIRNGRWPQQAAAASRNLGAGSPGLDPACAKWLKARDVALLGSDGVSDHLPSGVAETTNPIHQLMIVAMGVHLIDNCDLESLAEACVRRNQRIFLITVAPLRVVSGTGSPVNPLATF